MNYEAFISCRRVDTETATRIYDTLTEQPHRLEVRVEGYFRAGQEHIIDRTNTNKGIVLGVNGRDPEMVKLMAERLKTSAQRDTIMDIQ